MFKHLAAALLCTVLATPVLAQSNSMGNGDAKPMMQDDKSGSMSMSGDKKEHGTMMMAKPKHKKSNAMSGSMSNANARDTMPAEAGH